MLKRKQVILTFLVGLFITLLTPVTFASHNPMPRTAMYIGGIGAGCTMDYVKAVYGEPAEITEVINGGIKVVTYIYSDTFKVMARTSIRNTTDEDDLIVSGFTCTDKTLKTPFGVSVGMPFSEVSNKFGPGKERKHKKEKYHCYIADFVVTSFYVDKDGVIYKIDQIVE